jgi:hypothetical protein
MSREEPAKEGTVRDAVTLAKEGNKVSVNTNRRWRQGSCAKVRDEVAETEACV